MHDPPRGFEFETADLAFALVATRSLRWSGGWMLIGALVLAGTFPATALARTFTVSSTADEVDENPGDGVCAADGGECTLRAAVQETNALAGPDLILLPAGDYPLSLVGTDEDTPATGDLDVTDDLEIRGAGPSVSVIDADGIDRVIESTGVRLALHSLGLSDGEQFFGGCLRAVGPTWLEDVRIAGCRATSQGGAIGASGRLVVKRSTIRQSNAQFGGGCISSVNRATLVGVELASCVAGDGGGGGGAISASGSLWIQNSLIRESRAVFASAIHIRGELDLIGSTVSDQVAGSSAIHLSGLNLRSKGARIVNSTIANNRGRALTGAAFMRNTVLSGSQDVTCFSSREIVSLGGNVEDGDDCGLDHVTDLVNTEAMLGPLADNGGPTLSREPLPGSPLIDSATFRCPALDQRFFARPFGSACDRGAVEFGAGSPCFDSVDNDNDGSTDLADPGCTSALDATELEWVPGHALLTRTDGSAVTSIDLDGDSARYLLPIEAFDASDVALRDDGLVAVASRANGNVLEVDPRDGLPFLLGGDPSPRTLEGIAFEADGQLVTLVQLGDDETPGAGLVGRLDPETGREVEVSQSTSMVGVRQIAVSRATGDLFVSDVNPALGDRIWRIDPTTGLRQSIASAPDVEDPFGVVVEANGDVVFANRTAAQLARVAPTGGPVVPFFTFPSGPIFTVRPFGLALEPNGNLLAVESSVGGGRLDRVSPEGSLLDFARPSPVSSPKAVARIPESADVDGDGVPARWDLCPDVFDPSQSDEDGPAGPGLEEAGIADGTGDACQCGDADGDHRVHAADVAHVRAALTGTDELTAAPLCNVIGAIDAADADGNGLRDDCDLLDVVVMRRALVGAAPGIGALCSGLPE